MSEREPLQVYERRPSSKHAITQAYILSVQVSGRVYNEMPEESALWAIDSRGVRIGLNDRLESG